MYVYGVRDDLFRYCICLCYCVCVLRVGVLVATEMLCADPVGLVVLWAAMVMTLLLLAVIMILVIHRNAVTFLLNVLVVVNLRGR